MPKSYSGFKNFVARQPATKKINHQGWCGCAVGEYLEGSVAAKRQLWNPIGSWARENLPSKVYKRLDSATKHSRSVNTYGALNTFLQGLST